MAESLLGTIIAGRYEFVSAIGRGAFARTFMARDQTAGGVVAVKMFDRHHDSDLKALEMFEREATVMRAMRHHGIPEVHGVVREPLDGTSATFLIMEYIEGTSLRAIIDEQRALDPAEVLHLFLELLGILDYLHSRVPPIVHRDIKPSNIIVRSDGQPVLVDFGAVRREFLTPDEAGSTIVGTYGYMPYEQYMGQASPSSDLYSLAATFLHVLTGRAPREFMTGEGRIEVPAGLPGDARLHPLLARLLRTSPVERFASAREVRQALLGGIAITAPTPTPTSGSIKQSGNAQSPIARGALRDMTDLSALGPAPRPLTGATRMLFNRVAPGALDLMNSAAKPGDIPSAVDGLGLVFFSLVTAGVLPAVFIGMARSRRKRLRRFFVNGHVATAQILGTVSEKTAFDQTLSRVTYQFEADDSLHRDTDLVLPQIANRWQPGDTIQILYLPEFDYDSVIVSAR